MEILKQRLNKFRRRRKDLKYLNNRIWVLKYEILNDALTLEVNETKVKCFHKYNRRLKLITFFK